MPLTLTQNRYAALVGGVTTYFVQSAITDKGVLGDFAAFVMAIVDVDDIPADTYTRVATVADYDSYANSRATAVLNGDIYYRSSTVLQDFTSLTEAAAAATTIQEDVDDLLADWNVYYADFNATDEAIEMPLTDIKALTALITTYTDAVATTASAYADNTVAQAAQATATLNASDATERLTLAEGIDSYRDAVDSKIPALELSVDALSTLLNTLGVVPSGGFGSGSGYTIGYGTNFYRALNNFIFWVYSTADSIQNLIDAGSPSENDLENALHALYDRDNSTGEYFTFIGGTYSPSALATTSTNLEVYLTDGLVAQGTILDDTAVSENLELAQGDKSDALAAVTTTTTEAKVAEAEYAQAQVAEAAALTAVTDEYPAFDPANPTVVDV